LNTLLREALGFATTTVLQLSLST